MASAVLLQNKNVLYITMEMAEEKIAERIDANLLNVNIQEVAELPKQMFETKVNNLSKKTQGTLIIKEYPLVSLLLLILCLPLFQLKNSNPWDRYL